MIVQCCVCKKVRDDGKWTRLDDAPIPDTNDVSHGYCPECAANAFAQLAATAPKRSRRSAGKSIHAA